MSMMKAAANQEEWAAAGSESWEFEEKSQTAKIALARIAEQLCKAVEACLAGSPEAILSLVADLNSAVVTFTKGRDGEEQRFVKYDTHTGKLVLYTLTCNQYTWRCFCFSESEVTINGKMHVLVAKNALAKAAAQRMANQKMKDLLREVIPEDLWARALEAPAPLVGVIPAPIPAPIAPTPAPRKVKTVAIHVYFNPELQDHEYTTRTTPYHQGSWESHGTAFYAFQEMVPGTAPVHEYFNADLNDHEYTMRATPYPHGNWKRNGQPFYAYTTQQPGTVPVFEYFNADLNDHEYTTRATPYPHGNWKQIGQPFHVFTAPQFV